MTRYWAKLLLGLDYVVMFILFLCTGGDETYIFLIALVGILVALFISRYLRCPKCGRHQGKGQFFAQYCPYCGEYLEDW